MVCKMVSDPSNKSESPSPFSIEGYNFERIETAGGKRPLPPPGHRNLRITISYDGRAFSGYQFQPHAKTVQEVFTSAWQILTREKVLLFGCSRLDAGVSANHFVLNLYSQTERSCALLAQGLNGILRTNLCEPIAVYSVEEAPPLFHARFDAVGKHYRYLIWYGHGRHALWEPHAWHLRSKVPPSNLESEVQRFAGKHDFAAFRAQDCTARTTTRTIARVDCWQHPRLSELFVVDFWGDGFLKNMIRNMIGTAVDVCTKKLPSETIFDAFSHGDRTMIGQCAPAVGLTLERVYYSSEEFNTDASNGVRFFLC